MSDENKLMIVDSKTGELLTKGIEFTKTSMTLDPNTSYDNWLALGEKLNQMEGSIQWWIGDYLKFGEWSFGEKYAQAVNESQADTWRTYNWVSNSVDLSIRIDKLSWNHHRLVAPFDDKETQVYWLNEALKENWSVSDLRHAIKVKKFQDKVGKLPDDKYRVIYADPPWEYATPQHSREEQETTLDSHYPSLSLDKICALPIGTLAQEDAVLFLWATSPLLPQALEVIEAWGFEYKGAFVWDKVKHNVGHYNSVRHELLLIATKGSCLPDKRDDDKPILIDSVQTIERTEHSKKPNEFRQIIDYLYPAGKRIELFAREIPEGWDVWGNEVTNG